jgi:hypothetical protein
VSNEFIILRGSGGRKMGNPSIDPPDSIRDICAIDRNTVADEEIFRDILFDPFSISTLFLNAPSTIPDCPYLLRRFKYRLAERKGGKEKQKQDEEKHSSY